MTREERHNLLRRLSRAGRSIRDIAAATGYTEASVRVLIIRHICHYDGLRANARRSIPIPTRLLYRYRERLEFYAARGYQDGGVAQMVAEEVTGLKG